MNKKYYEDLFKKSGLTFGEFFFAIDDWNKARKEELASIGEDFNGLSMSCKVETSTYNSKEGSFTSRGYTIMPYFIKKQDSRTLEVDRVYIKCPDYAGKFILKEGKLTPCNEVKKTLSTEDKKRITGFNRVASEYLKAKHVETKKVENALMDCVLATLERIDGHYETKENGAKSAEFIANLKKATKVA